MEPAGRGVQAEAACMQSKFKWVGFIQRDQQKCSVQSKSAFSKISANTPKIGVLARQNGFESLPLKAEQRVW